MHIHEPQKQSFLNIVQTPTHSVFTLQIKWLTPLVGIIENIT